MNRVIKFRAWYPAENRMEYQDNKTPVWVGDVLTGDYYIPMQYTGLRDKNDKEIYEGDTCQGEYAGSSMGIYKNAIVWNLSELGWSFANSPLWTWDWIEVIGNIFENPELLR